VLVVILLWLSDYIYYIIWCFEKRGNEASKECRESENGRYVESLSESE